ncbi:BON domain-containing protein [Paracoccaceae bacterium Fryx2]|nr:BON domain-containing protein [Paracoccaceae bacterium Fryx2]
MPEKTSPPAPLSPDRPERDGARRPTAQAPNNAASNGYWIHDDLGPKHYVAPSMAADPEGMPDSGAPDSGAPDSGALESGGPDSGEPECARDAGDLIARIDAALRGQPGLQTQRVHVSAEDGRLILAGIVPSGADRERAGAVAGAAARGVAVENRLWVDETLQPREAGP